MTDSSLNERRARASRRSLAPADPSAPGGLDDPAIPPAPALGVGPAVPPAPVLEPPPEATIAGLPIGARLAAARRRRTTGELDVLPEPAPPGSVAKRRAVLVGIAVTVGAAATGAWKNLSGGGTDVVSPPPAPPRRAQQITAKEAGAFEDRDQSLARSIAPAVGAEWRKTVRSVRKRPTSSSGLIPSSRRRNSFRMSRSPKVTEVLL